MNIAKNSKVVIYVIQAILVMVAVSDWLYLHITSKNHHDALDGQKLREIAQRIETSKDNPMAERVSRYFVKDAEFHIEMADYLRRLERSALINVGLIVMAGIIVVCLVSKRVGDGS